MPVPTVATWQNKTSRFLRDRDNPLITDIDTLLTAFHSNGKTDIQKQKILVLMLYVCTEWLVNKSKSNWRRPYVNYLIGEIEAELRTTAMTGATQARVGAAGLTMKENPIELLQPKDLSAKYGLTGGTSFHRVNGHSAEGFVAGFGRRHNLTGYSAQLTNVIPGDYVDELRILAAGNADQLHDLKRNLAYLSSAERRQRQLSLGDDDGFHLNGDPVPYTSPAGIPDLCVIDRLELIYVSSVKAAGKFHHSSFRSGKPVLFAGELRLNHGVVNYINNMSGHYRPSTQDLLNAVTLLRDKYGCDLSLMRVEDALTKPIWPTAVDFLKFQGVRRVKPTDGDKVLTAGKTI